MNRSSLFLDAAASFEMATAFEVKVILHQFNNNKNALNQFNHTRLIFEITRVQKQQNLLDRRQATQNLL